MAEWRKRRMPFEVSRAIARAERGQHLAGVHQHFLGDNLARFVQDARVVLPISHGARQRGDGRATGAARSAAEGESSGCPRAGGEVNKSSPIV